MTLVENNYGFQYGPVAVTRIHSDDKTGYVIIELASKKRTVEIYVTKTGKMRLYSGGKEIELPKEMKP